VESSAALKRPEGASQSWTSKLTFYPIGSYTPQRQEPKPQMHTTISQMLYPDRQAFFEKVALSLPPQPAIKIGPAPLPGGQHKEGLRNLRSAVPTETLSTAQRGMKASQRSQRDHRPEARGQIQMS
jgi:hypothetical protein